MSRHRSHNPLLFLAVLGAALFPSQPAAAADDTWFLYAGGFFLDAKTELRSYSSILGEGPTIDFEDDLGMDADANEERYLLGYRFAQSRRHQLSLQYLRVSRYGNDVKLDEQIVWGDVIFRVGAEIDSEIRTEDIDLHYTYTFYKKPGAELGFSAGLHGLRATSTLTGTGTVVAPNATVQLVAEEIDETVPLPLVGLSGSLRLASWLQGHAGARILDVEIAGIDARFIDAWLRFEARVWKNIGLGVGYAWLESDANLEADGALELTKVHWDYHGLEAFLTLRFR